MENKNNRYRAWLRRLVVRWREKRRERQVIEKCGCVCYCPKCKDILNDQADCTDTDLVYYHCNTCGEDSRWTFDAAPCPILLSSHNSVDNRNSVQD